MASSMRFKQYSRIRRQPYSRRMRKRELYAQGIMLARAVTAAVLSQKAFTVGLTVPVLFSVTVLLTCETLAAVSQIALNDVKDSSRAVVDISRQLLPPPALNLSGDAPPIETFDYDIPFPGSSGPRHCGAGRLSNFLTRLVAVPCEVEQMDACCLEHDICYANAHRSQAYCDAKFCSCLHAIKTNFYCSGFTQYGMCIIARGFGHHFYTARDALLPRSEDVQRWDDSTAKVASAESPSNSSHSVSS